MSQSIIRECPVCGERFNRKTRLRKHVFEAHLPPMWGLATIKQCWCGMALAFHHWDNHVGNSGGLQPHYARFALGLEGKHGR